MQLVSLRKVLPVATGLFLVLGTPVASASEVATVAHEVTPLLIGASVPSVPVTNLAGETVDLAEVAKGSYAVLVFFRGGW